MATGPVAAGAGGGPAAVNQGGVGGDGHGGPEQIRSTGWLGSVTTRGTNLSLPSSPPSHPPTMKGGRRANY